MGGLFVEELNGKLHVFFLWQKEVLCCWVILCNTGYIASDGRTIDGR
jgi:hypothetical protein